MVELSGIETCDSVRSSFGALLCSLVGRRIIHHPIPLPERAQSSVSQGVKVSDHLLMVRSLHGE